MDFSIIIPVYNVGNYLRECIESVIKQSGVSYEIILVDDGSKDESALICDEYAEKYDFISVIHKENGGLSDARNSGIVVAIGEYILFVDGDDKIEDGSLYQIFKIIKKQQHPDIVCLDLSKFFDDKEEIIPMNDGVTSEINNLEREKALTYLSELPKYPASACTKAIKRSLFQNNNLFFTKGILSEDLEWSVRLFLAANTFSYCPNRYYYYRQARTASITNTPSEKKVMDILDTYTKWTNFAMSVNEAAEKKMICSFMEYIFRFLLLYYDYVGKEKQMQFRQNVSDGAWILGTRKDIISRCIALSYRICGIKVTGKLLRKYLNLRGY